MERAPERVLGCDLPRVPNGDGSACVAGSDAEAIAEREATAIDPPGGREGWTCAGEQWLSPDGTELCFYAPAGAWLCSPID